MARKKTNPSADQPESTDQNEERSGVQAKVASVSTESLQKDVNEVKYSKDQIMRVAQQKFGLNRTEAIAALFDAPAEMTVAEAETFVKKFKEKKVK